MLVEYFNNNFYVVSIILFLWLCVIIGIRYSNKITDINSFAISRNYFGTFALVCTITASFVGGGVVIGTAEKVFSSGIASAVAVMGFGFQLLLTGLVIAPRMAKFKDCISMGDMFEEHYGTYAKILIGVTWLLFCIGVIVAQTIALGRTFSTFLNLDPMLNGIIGLAIVTAYSYFGGIRSVVATDVFQFMVIIVILPLVIICGLYEVGGFTGMYTNLPSSHFSLTNEDYSIFLLISTFGAFLISDALIPPVMQRLLMAKDIASSRRSYIYASVLVFILCFISAMLGLIGYALNPEINSTSLIPYYFEHTLPVFFKGFAISALIAVIMSSADSYLNSASVALVRDVIKPFYKHKDISPKCELHIAKRSTILIGCIAVFFNLAFNDITTVLLQAYGFWGPTVLAVLFGLIFGVTIPKVGFYACFISGTVAKLCWELSPYNYYVSGLMFGIAINFLTFLIFYKLKSK